jgi:tetratricopeptide (TPR) repeat protein
LGIRAFFVGDYARAVHHLAAASGGAEDAAPDVAYEALLAWVRQASPFNLDVFFCTLTYSAWCQCLLGAPDRALAMSAQTLALAERLQHPFSLALALDFRVQVMLHLEHDPEGTRELSARQLALANENGFPLWVASGNARMGWVEARLGRASDGVTLIRGSLQLMQALGSMLVVPWGYLGLTEALLLAGRAEEALAASDEAIEFCSSRLGAGAEPMLLGLRARALAACGQATAAEAQWSEALERLHARGAKWPELCVAVEYARFLRDAGRGVEGRELLAPLYAGMATELDLPVMQSARELLATH